MNPADINPGERPQAAAGTPIWKSLVLLCFLAIAGFFLFTEHRAHVFGALPYLLLLACPLLHLLHHRGHGGGDHHGHISKEGDPS